RLRRSPDRILCHLPGGYRFGLVGTPLGPDVSRRRAGYQKERKHRGQQAFSHSRSSGRQSRVAGRAPPNSFGNEAIGTLVIGELIENKVLPFVARSALNRRRAVPKRRAKSARDFCRSTPPRRGKGICKVWLKPVHTRHCGAWLQMGIECWRVKFGRFPEMHGRLYCAIIWSMILPVWFAVAQQRPQTGGSMSDRVPAGGCGPAAVHFEVKTEKHHLPVRPENGKALVYFLQDDTQFQSRPRPTSRIGIDGTWVGATKSNSYFYVSVDPGEHDLCSSWQSFVGFNTAHTAAAVGFKT